VWYNSEEEDAEEKEMMKRTKDQVSNGSNDRRGSVNQVGGCRSITEIEYSTLRYA